MKCWKGRYAGRRHLPVLSPWEKGGGGWESYTLTASATKRYKRYNSAKKKKTGRYAVYLMAAVKARATRCLKKTNHLNTGLQYRLVETNA